MAKEYSLIKVTTETYIATCTMCGKPFRSDVETKAIQKVTSHYTDKHGVT
jgi:transcription elongation factor Elf1